ncbi:hypothetical protein MKW98_029502, partial [Papaver atlanticum]
LPAPPALYPPLHQHEDDDMDDLLGNAYDEQGVFVDDSDNSSTNSSNISTTSNQSEISIKDHNEAIIPNENEELEGKNLNFQTPSSPPIIVNPYQWDDFGFYTLEPTVPFNNPNPYEITWEPIHTPTAKRPNPSHYLYSFLP